jgi:hypothetical protein
MLFCSAIFWLLVFAVVYARIFFSVFFVASACRFLLCASISGVSKGNGKKDGK